MNALVADRTAFLVRHPERVELVGGRRWGVIDINPGIAGDGGTDTGRGIDGAAPTLVLLPGTLGRADVFWRLMDRLTGQARLISLTFPASHRLSDWAQDVVRLLDRRGIDRAHMLGSSLGGYLAQWLAGAHPDRCDGLIAANTLADTEMLQTMAPYAGALHRTPIAELRAGFGAGLGRWAEEHPGQRDLVDLLLADVAGRIPARHLRARLLVLKHGPPLPEPTIDRSRIAIIESDDDPLIPPAVRAAVRQRLDPAEVYRFAWGGHFPYVVRPGPYAAAVAERLGLDPGPDRWDNGETRTK